MKMSRLLLVGIVFPAAAFAAEDGSTEGPRPVTCMVTDGAQVKNLPCSVVSTKAPASVKGVCVFANSSWKYGTVKYDPVRFKNNKNPNYMFVTEKVCDRGVQLMRPRASTDLQGPSVADYTNGKTELVDLDTKTRRFISKLSGDPLSGTNKVPITCYLAENRGVETSAQPCRPNPNKRHFCRLEKVSDSRYEGMWWVYYSDADQRGRQVCRAGVQISDVSKAVSDDEEDQSYTKALKMSGAEYVATYVRAPALDSDAHASKVRVMSCTVQKGSRTTRYTCANDHNPTSFDDWSNDEASYRETLVQKYAAAQGPKVYESIQSTRKKIESSGKQADRDKYNAQLDAILDPINDKVKAEMATLTTFPVEKTEAVALNCHVGWKPNGAVEPRYTASTESTVRAPSSTGVESRYVYIFERTGGRFVKTPCESVEVLVSTKVKAE